MNTKSTTQKQDRQQLPAGISLSDNNIEFVGCRETKTVVWIQNGETHEFSKLPAKIYSLLKKDFLSDAEAISALKQFFPLYSTVNDRVELYTYYMYGDLDHSPDIKNGRLQASENFRDTEDCPSLRFNNKSIDVNGVPLKKLYIKMLDAMAKGVPDKAIAFQLGKAQTTYDFHKSKLFKILEVHSKPEAVATAFKHRIICDY